MNCQCGGDTRVVDSRARGKYVERRRVCEACGQRFPTWEVSKRPDHIRKISGISAEEKRLRRATDPVKARENYARARTRKAAREEAREKGVPVETVFRQWGVA